MATRSDAPEGYVSRAEMEAAVAAAARQAAEATLEALTKREGGAAPASDTEAFARSLAGAIASLSDQTSRVKRVAPEEMERRAAARERMVAAILRFRDAGVVPSYVLKHSTYLDEQFIEPTYVGPDKTLRARTIEWAGVPNQAMRPANEAAREIFAAFCESIGQPVTDGDGSVRVGAGGLVVIDKGRPAEPMRDGRGRVSAERVRLLDRFAPDELVQPPVMPGAVSARQPHTSRAI